MPKITDALEIRGKLAKNRIVFVPCLPFSIHGGLEGYYGNQHLEHYAKVAEGGAGIIIVQASNVTGISGYTDLWSQGSRSTLRKISDVIHSNGALAFMQLSFGSDRETDLNMLTTAQIESKQTDLLEASFAVRELGFDGLQFHFAHRFLLCKFFDKEANKRTDRFNGGTDARTRIVGEIIPKIRQKNGDDFILDLRMGAFLPDLETGIETARFLEKSGIDMLNITFSMIDPPSAPADFPLSNMAYGGYLIKQAVNIPVTGVGELTNAKKIETLIGNGYADLAGIGRGLLADPFLPGKIFNGEFPFECKACANCFWFTDHRKCPARINAATVVE